MIRYYILPIERDVSGMARGPKYLPWRFDPDPPALVDVRRFGLMDYGLVDACLICAPDISQAQHEALVAEVDVVAAPENIDQHIGAPAISIIQNVLEALRIPAGWVDTTYTYRQLLRMVAGLFQFAQRHHGLHKEQLIDNQSQLDLRWNQVPLDRRQRIQATADSLGYDYSAVTNQWLIRRILKHLADQWGDRTFIIAGVEL